MTPKKQRPPSEWHLAVRPFFFEVTDSHAVEIDEQSWIVDKAGQLQIQIHVGLVNDRLACIGVDIRSFRADIEGATVKGAINAYHPFDQRGGFTAINSPVFRSIPIGNLIERAIADTQGDYEQMAAQSRQGMFDAVTPDRERLARIHESIADAARTGARRGPKPALTEDVLRSVVTPAYITGGRRPVVAVQTALSKYRGGEQVTIDQARKAVVQARAVGMIPPARGKGRP